MGIQVQRTAEEQMGILMGLMLDLQKQMAQDRRKLFDEIKKLHLEMEKEVVAAVKPLEAGLALREANLLKRLLIEKGLITEDEFLRKLQGE